jgi:predicted thioredoxin/glutaredoxin
MRDLTLDIYLDQNCFGCDQAEALAADIDGWFPQVRVVIHWLSTELRLPTGVVAVPAFLLEGRLIQYGTPERQQITNAVLRALGVDDGEAVT